MDKLNSILETWTKNRNIEELISLGSFSNPDAIQDSLNQYSDDKREKTVLLLDEITTALQVYISDLTEQRNSTKEQIDATLKSAQACLSYGSALGLGSDKGKRK